MAVDPYGFAICRTESMLTIVEASNGNDVVSVPTVVEHSDRAQPCAHLPTSSVQCCRVR